MTILKHLKFTCMKKVVFASVVLASSMIFAKADAQVYVSARIGWPAPPIPVIVQAPPVMYQAPAPYYQAPVPDTYYEQPVPAPTCRREVPINYYRRGVPEYAIDYRAHYPRYYHEKHWRHDHHW
jgi:hypothetical protein